MIESDNILYLELEDVLLLYAVRFECSQAEAGDQLLRPDLLESALERPLQYAYYDSTDIALQAAALAHGIAENGVFCLTPQNGAFELI
ncbi:MAG: hypothetical protein H0X37_24380 [Herpetosiphonaceae bacterium]|nr:hypothetical protein [Herpetosiphonaceae bacterium]